ncbi:MAG: hypothetical protein HYS44_00100, partial [Candidatus Niyogibacteria bacterium]|nr:hypothetical protein [Candidatus Niyogibacteria bacterium]
MADEREINKISHFSDMQLIPLKEAERLTGYAKDYIGYLCRTNRIPAKRAAGNEWMIDLDSLVTYKARAETMRRERMRNGDKTPQPPLEESVKIIETPDPVTPVANARKIQEPRLVRFDSWEDTSDALRQEKRIITVEAKPAPSNRPAEKKIPHRHSATRSKSFALSILVFLFGLVIARYPYLVNAAFEKIYFSLDPQRITAALAENIQDSPFLDFKGYPYLILKGNPWNQSALIVKTLRSSLESFPQSLGKRAAESVPRVALRSEIWATLNPEQFAKDLAQKIV